jgi:hypothetical protein
MTNTARDPALESAPDSRARRLTRKS